MGTHIINGEFQSDKYPSCPAGKVPLSVKDKAAQPLLWQYAQTHRSIDPEFSDDLETALRAAGYSPPTVDDDRVLVIRARLAAGVSWKVDGTPDQEPEVRRILKVCAKRIEELAGVAPDARAHAVVDCFAHEQEVAWAASQLAELHAIATAHNPRLPSPEHRARFEAHQRELDADPVRAKRAWENLTRALDARERMSLSERTKCEALWDAWDAEREPHAKTILLLRLGETVAQWMSHVEALEREIDKLNAALVALASTT